MVRFYAGEKSDFLPFQSQKKRNIQPYFPSSFQLPTVDTSTLWRNLPSSSRGDILQGRVHFVPAVSRYMCRQY